MAGNEIKDKYVSLEDFFMAHAEQLTPLVGARVAQYAWGLKDLDPCNEDAERSCRIVQEAVTRAAEGRTVDWVIMVSESHDVLSLEEWIEDVVLAAKAESRGYDTGYGDLDINLETQLACGRQLESFHSGDWAKEKLRNLFEPESFCEEAPLVCSFKMPLPQLIAKLDRDLDIVTRGGMRHPYKCSVGVGALCLRLGATSDEPEQIVPVVRRTRVSDVGDALSQMGLELKDRFKGLISTIKEQQDNLRLLPEGWPTDAIWNTMQEWSMKRFIGDNGLVGSDLFNENWAMSTMPHEIHKKCEESTLARTLEIDACKDAFSSIDFTQRMAKRREGVATKACAEEAVVGKNKSKI